MYGFFRDNAGNGPGKLLYEVYYNLTFATDAQLYPTTSGPQSAAMYKGLWAVSGTVPPPDPDPDPDPTPIPDPGGTTSSAPQPYPAHSVAIYKMMWAQNGPNWSTINPKFNVWRLAFGQGNPVNLVGWGNQGEATAIAEMKKARARGVRIQLSVGGMGGALNTSNRQGFVDGVMNNVNSKIPLDGLDWDHEAVGVATADFDWICRELKRLRGPNFAITLVPNGGNIGQYMPLIQTAQNGGYLSAFGQQFYDAAVTWEAADARIQQAIAAGIPVSKYEPGMMNPPGNVPNGYWDNNTCASYMQRFKTKYPTIKGAYLWEAQRAGASEWADRLSPIIWS
jgi:hypothetical protein